MKFSADWQDSAPNAAPEERATVADLRLYVADQNVTLHVVDGVTEDHLTLPLYSLAEGLAHDWWTLFGGRDQEISLVRHRMGYAVPDVRMTFDGSAFEIRACQRAYANPDVRFWAGPSEVLTRAGAEQRLEEFISRVAERLSARKIADTPLALRWERVKRSRHDPDEAAFCEAAGALRLDPYQIDDATAAVIERAAALFASESLSELLAGTQPSGVASVLDWVEGVERRPAHKSRVADLRDVAIEAALKAPEHHGERSWALGYRRARAVRKILGLENGEVFKTYKALASRLGAGGQFELVSRKFASGVRALRCGDDHATHIHLRDHGGSPVAKTSELFTFARAVGDAACFPTPARAPVNDLHEAKRQAAGRAFAAEFLAPVEEVLSMRQDRHDISAIADARRVSEEVVYRQLENVQRIREACA